MMRDNLAKLVTGSVLGGAALLLAACGGGGGGDEAANAGQNDLGNAGVVNGADPMAVEMDDGADAPAPDLSAGNGAAPSTSTGNDAAPTTGGDAGGSNVGGDTGGNSEADVPGM